VRNFFQGGLTFLTFAGLTLAMGMPSQNTRALETNLHVINVSPDAIPSAIVSHSAKVAIDLPMPQGTHGDNIAGVAIDLPMPQGTRDNGETAIDLPMPQGTHGDNIAEVAIDLPMPQGTRDNGETTNIDLPMPQGTHGDGKIS
jgi:hypothetical protein